MLVWCSVVSRSLSSHRDAMRGGEGEADGSMIVIDARTVIVLSLFAAGQGRWEIDGRCAGPLMVMMMDGDSSASTGPVFRTYDTRHATRAARRPFWARRGKLPRKKDPLHPPPQLRFPCFVSFRCRDAHLPWCLLSTLIPLQLLPPCCSPLLRLFVSASSILFSPASHQALGPFHPVAGTHVQVANPGLKIPWRRGTRWGPSQPSVEATGLPRRPVGPSYISEGRTLIQIVDETRGVDKGTFVGRHNAMLECHTTWDRVISGCPPSAFCWHEWGR